ncbi:MAG: hypothetical protein B7L53_01275 [Thermofilum sp. NZ13]|nr:MAG: hypothetical protein B7L53_01275 [Thermofilum sp. NZ13]
MGGCCARREEGMCPRRPGLKAASMRPAPKGATHDPEEGALGSVKGADEPGAATPCSSTPPTDRGPPAGGPPPPQQPRPRRPSCRLRRCRSRPRSRPR